MDELKAAKLLLARKLARKNYLTGELLDFLQEKGISLELANEAIRSFEEAGYISDENWALSEAKKWARLGKGPKWLSYHFKQKGVQQELIKKAMAGFSCNLEEIIKKRAKNNFTPENRKKIVNYLCRRGFDFDTIESELNKIWYN